MPYTIRTPSAEEAIAFICDATWGMAQKSPEGNFLWLNQAYCRILDAPIDLIVGTHYSQWTDPRDLKIDEELCEKIRTGEIPSYTLVKRYIKRGHTPQMPRIVWGMLSVSGKWEKDQFISFQVQFQPYDVYQSPKQTLKLTEILMWTKDNWRTIVTAVAVILSLTWTGSARLLEVLQKAKDTAESVDTIILPSSPSPSLPPH